MTSFRSAIATGTDWKAVVAEVGSRLLTQSSQGQAPTASQGQAPTASQGQSPTGLGLVYATEALADHFSDIVQTLRQRTGVPHWVGCVASGVCGSTPDGAAGSTSGEYHDAAALSVLIAPWSDDEAQVLETVAKPDGLRATLADAWATSHGPVFGLVHGDPRNHLINDLVDGLPSAGDGYFMGGLSSLADTPVHVADQPTGGGLSGVLISASVPVMVTHSQGCSPVGPMHRISSGDRSIIGGLDDRPALDVLKEDIGEVLARDLGRIGGYIHVAMPVPGSDTGDYTVRNLVGIDPNGGMLAVGDEVHIGDSIMFVRRDPESARKDFEDKLNSLKDRVGDQSIKGAVFVSCVARGAAMFGEEGREVRLIHEILGDFPLTGFYANGEICGNRMYGYTGVLSVFL